MIVINAHRVNRVPILPEKGSKETTFYFVRKKILKDIRRLWLTAERIQSALVWLKNIRFDTHAQGMWNDEPEH
jgi:hypothetical protein